MFEVRNLSFGYTSRPVLRDVSFVVSPGEIVSVVGANGSGKTTLIRILATLLQPNGGQVLVDGQDALARPLRYRRLIGYLPESVALYDDMTVKEYLKYRAELKGEPAKRVRRRVSEAVEMCRIRELMDEPIGRLSAGTRKRVGLADALLLRPRILLLDDFLAGIDRAMRMAMGEILSEAAAFSSVIITGHEIEAFSTWSTRLLTLRKGVLSSSISAAGGDPAEITARVEESLNGGEE